MKYTAAELAQIVGATKLVRAGGGDICHISIHTDNIVFPHNTLFAALPGEISDGHRYIPKAYDTGVRFYLASDETAFAGYSDVNVVLVPDVLKALQQLAKYHRQQFSALPVLAITGSNGKTIIKEWLYQMLYGDYYIVKSPKSYNSQIGVPLSLFQIEKQHDLGIFEVGISKLGEMEAHAKMIAPTVGIFTNIGDAHDEGFDSREQKIAEKAKLFAHCEVVVCCRDHEDVYRELHKLEGKQVVLDWSTRQSDCYLYVRRIAKDADKVVISTLCKGQEDDFEFDYADKSSVENILHCITFMYHMGLSAMAIQKRIRQISGLDMRLEMKAGLQGSTIINDAYSADLNAMKIALEFMNQQAPQKIKEIIISTLEQSGMTEAEVVASVSLLAAANAVTKVHYISDGDVDLPVSFEGYRSKAEFLDQLPMMDIADKFMLVKGSRKARLEDIVHRLSYKGHSTKLLINLDALASNIRVYRSLLAAETEIIAVVKAGAYGTGSVEVARLLEQNGVTRLAVAFVDEAIELRKQGVTMPIIVFNADVMSMRDVVIYDLELEVYTFEQLTQLQGYAAKTGKHIKIHLKLDTGMHRLGFMEAQIDKLISVLSTSKHLIISSIFSHLASSEDQQDDKYTEGQFSLFDKLYSSISTALDISPKRHILNSSGITRFPHRQYEMVRLGLGLYGIDGGRIVSARLRKVHSLHSTVLQVKQLRKGDSVGYNRKTKLDKDTLTAVVNIGYADGLLRCVGNRKYAVHIHGQPAEILGTVSMDLIIVDLSLVPSPMVGDTVIIFDESHPIETLAAAAGTIPYEIMSRISERVERIYIRE